MVEFNSSRSSVTPVILLKYIKSHRFLAINRAVNYYRKRGYSDKWIEERLKGILSRNKLTDIWKESGITKDYEYGILTNEIYQEIFGMKASEYKVYKNIRKESLRDNMTDIEVALTNLGEVATR